MVLVATYIRNYYAFFFLLAISFSYAARSEVPEENDSLKSITRTVVPFPDTVSRDFYSVLSLDGGGLRGIITTEVLAELEDAIKRQIVMLKVKIESRGYQKAERLVRSTSEFDIDMADYFQTIAGVSAGSWIATYLVSKGGNGNCDRVFQEKAIKRKYGDIRCGSIEGLKVFFLRYGRDIYPPHPIPITILPRIYGIPKVKVDGVNTPRFSHTGLEAVLDKFLGETSTSNIHTTFFIHAYDLLRRATVLIVSDPNESPPQTYTYVFDTDTVPRAASLDKWETTVEATKGKTFRLKDLTRASSAAPMSHAAKSFNAIEDETFAFYCVDGALMANNPTLQTLIFMAESDRVGRIDKMAVVSIGMGISAGEYQRHGQAGAFQWMLQSQDFLYVIMDGGSELIQAQLDLFFYKSLKTLTKPGQYLRIQTAYDKSTPEGQVLADMMEYKNVPKLQKIGKTTANEFSAAMTRFVENFLLIEPKSNKTTDSPSPSKAPTTSPQSPESP